MTLRLALVGGPMYDGLYEMLSGRDVEVVVHSDHPSLNRAVAALLARGERIDVLSTHSKYAPSQAEWLRPLDHVVEPAVLRPLSPRAVELCRFRGPLLSVPRNVDVRVLWANRDMCGAEPVPATWVQMLDSPLVFGLPGRESGLFGTFFEVVTTLGGRLFDDALRPTLCTDEARRAVEMLVSIARRAPSSQPDWHYDDVDAALGDGRVAVAAAWPGATGALRGSRVGGSLEPHPYLGGPDGVVSYAGCHSWAIPTTCGDIDGARALLVDLASAEANQLEAASGAVCAHAEVLAAQEPVDEVDARRLEITRATIASGMITYPPLPRFPDIEDAGWLALHRALLGEIDPGEATDQMQAVAEEALG